MHLGKKIGFYSSNLDNYIEEIRKGDFRYLPWIFCVFAEDSVKHKLRAAETLNKVLVKISFDKFYKIDIQMRETMSMEWRIDWSKLDINYFIVNNMSLDEKRAVFIFASF